MPEPTEDQIQSLLTRLYAIKDEGKYYFFEYGDMWIRELLENKVE
tara:strand:+ start:302 stop:436 length:135 start_codon:yes stop_codon:yes gene_type:complete